METVIEQSMQSFEDDLFKRKEGLSVNLESSIFKRNPDVSEDTKCYICLCPIEENEEIYELECKHIFHKECLDNAILHQHTTCCICRCEIPINEEKNETEPNTNAPNSDSSGHIIIYESL
jgi:hypothetical protein